MPEGAIVGTHERAEVCRSGATFFLHFQSKRADLTFTFSCTAIKAPAACPPHTPAAGAQLTTPERTRVMASRAAALLLLALVCIEFAAGKQEGGFQFPGCIGGRCVCTSSPLALTHSAFVLLQLKLCWTAVRAKPPNSSHFRESKATGFRILGPAVTSTLLCEGQTSKKPLRPSIGGHRVELFFAFFILIVFLFCITSFVTKNGLHLCVSHPSEERWVKKHIDALEKRKQKHAEVQVNTQPQ